MVLKYIKSIWQSNYISQAKTEVTTFIDTADEQLQSLKPSLKEGIDIFFTNLVALITALLWSNYFVSNFVNNTNLWVGDIIGSTGDESYKEWSKRLESLHYYFEQDIDYILERMIANKMKFDDIFTSHDGQHPPILKMVLSKKICVETFVILEDILSFANRLDKDILETVLWPKMHDRMARYKPFLKYDTPRYKITLRKKVKEI